MKHLKVLKLYMLFKCCAVVILLSYLCSINVAGNLTLEIPSSWNWNLLYRVQSYNYLAATFIFGNLLSSLRCLDQETAKLPFRSSSQAAIF